MGRVTMEIYSHSKISIVQHERLVLLKKPQIVTEIYFSQNREEKFLRSPVAFRQYSKNFFKNYLHRLGVFAPSLGRSLSTGHETPFDGKYLEIECSDCDIENFSNCGLIKTTKPFLGS